MWLSSFHLRGMLIQHAADNATNSILDVYGVDTVPIFTFFMFEKQ